MSDSVTPPTNDLPTRQRIIQEATRLFAAQGVKATTVAAIEAAAGLRAGSGGLHRHFATKDMLVSEVLASQIRRGEQARGAAVALPRPKPEHIRGFLEIVGALTLNEANEMRDVALIMVREAANYPELIGEQQRANDDIAYRTTGDHIRELFASEGSAVPDDFDLDAFGYLLVAPLIYYRLKEWTSGEKVRGLSDERIIAMWARIFEPIMQELFSMLPPAVAE
jgi:AcrR family transcriptional regulator